MSSSADLPHGWAVARLGNLGDWGSGGTPSKSNKAYYESGTIPWLVIGDLNESVVYRSNLCITEEGLKNSSAKLLPTGTLLVAMYGSIGKTAITGVQCATNQAIAYCQPHEGINLNYLHRIMQWLKPNLIVQGKGGTQQNISQGILKNISVPLAPSNEQRRIADKLDRVLARVDAANEHLSRVGPLLKRFRQAVLDAAVSGGLLGKDVVWTEVKLGDLLDCIEAGKNVTCIERPPEGDEKGLVKISSVTWGEFDNNESKTLLPNMFINEELRIRSGDFLISRANTIDLVGACVIVSKVSRNLFLSDKVLRLKFLDDLKPWVLIVMRSSFGRDQIERLASGNQLSMRNLSQSSIRSICIPMPPDEERKLLVEKVNALLSYADNMQRQVMQICGRLDHLVPAVLSKAFGGELVSQNPNDESASVLLARLAEAKASESQKLIRRKRQASV